MSNKLDAEIRAMASIARGAFGLTPAGSDDVNLLCGRILDAVAALRAELAALRSRLAAQGAREVAEARGWTVREVPKSVLISDGYDGEEVYYEDGFSALLLLPSDGGEG